MMREYNIVFKLPCEKTFTFDILVCNDGYDPTKEIGNYPSRYMLDYFLLYVPQLQDYSGSEISNGTVLSVCLKESRNIKEDESENKEESTQSLKSLYWKNGYIIRTRGNGNGIICNNMAACGSTGSIVRKSELDESLLDDSCHSNDIIEVWDNTATCFFNPYDIEDVRKNCRLVWTRFVEMSREEIEKKLNLPKGSLVIKD